MGAYGVGYLNLINYTVLDAELPEGLIMYDGETNGSLNGQKHKKAYGQGGRVMWFIASANMEGMENVPVFLCRSTIDYAGDNITFDYAFLPFIGQQERLPNPVNQLTVDGWGNVYFPGGTTLDDDGSPVIIKATVISEDPFTISYTIAPTDIRGDVSTWGICLDPYHMQVATYVQNNDEQGSDYAGFFNTNTMAPTYQTPMGTQGKTVYNIECDVSDSDNYGWMYCIIPDYDNPGNAIIAFTTAAMVNTSCEEDELTVAVDSIGQVITMTRDPANRVLCRYTPGGAGALTYDTQSTIAGYTGTPTHHDIRRDHSDETGLGLGIDPEYSKYLVEAAPWGAYAGRYLRNGCIIVSTAYNRERRVAPT